MTSKREDSPTPGFSTITPLPDPNVGELPPITASTFTTKSPDNTPLANIVSTLANPDPVISPAFVEANYEVLESILRDHKRLVYNEDLRTKLDYYSEECDEEIKIEPLTARMGAGLKGNLTARGLQDEERKNVGVMEETFLYCS
ncbi:hypothetical protein Tco_0166208 [Tanacetum coccineum]